MHARAWGARHTWGLGVRPRALRVIIQVQGAGDHTFGAFARHSIDRDIVVCYLCMYYMTTWK